MRTASGFRRIGFSTALRFFRPYQASAANPDANKTSVDGSGFCTSFVVGAEVSAAMSARVIPVEEGSVMAGEITALVETAVAEEAAVGEGAVSERDSGRIVVTVDWKDGDVPEVVLVAPVVVVVPAPVTAFTAELF